jgi:glycerate-2-kinase
MIVRNSEDLASRGNARGRKLVLDIVEHALQQVNFRNLVRQLVNSEDHLRIGSLSYDLQEIHDIYVVGAGKHVTFAADALKGIIRDRIRECVVVEKKGWGVRTEGVRVVEGSHPIPDAHSATGAQEIVKLVKRADADDLVIVCVTGGCTSLTTLPPNGIPLEDAAEVTRMLLRSGAPIEDMNAVRKHLSQVGGGKLAMMIHPAKIVGLIAVDEVAGVPWGPTVPDTTTFSDAIDVLMTYGLWEKAPESVKRYLERADPLEETPKIEDFERARVNMHNVIFARNEMLCKAAERKALELGMASAIISTSLEGEARHVGTVLASIAKEIEKNARPFEAPCVLVAGGETTVTISGGGGEGGRNQELALAAAMRISGSNRIVIASVGSDGSDGPTDIAGAIVDGHTLNEARESDINLEERLSKHDSSNVLRYLRDAIYTNDTGTNLMDLIIAYVGSDESLEPY